MDPSERGRTGFLREICRSLEQTGVAGATAGGSSGGAAAMGGAGAHGGGASTLRFMAYLCLAAFEVNERMVRFFFWSRHLLPFVSVHM